VQEVRPAAADEMQYSGRKQGSGRDRVLQQGGPEARFLRGHDDSAHPQVVAGAQRRRLLSLR